MEQINTKYGVAVLGNHGYYKLTGDTEYCGKLLHRVIYEDYHNITLLNNAVVHHKDGNKLNNSIDNLEMMDRHSHTALHFGGKNNKNYGKHLSKNVREKISNTLKGRKLPKKTRDKLVELHTERFMNNDKEIFLSDKTELNTQIAMSKHQNTTGYFRVTKGKNKQCAQGFTWCYKYYDENGKQQQITSVDINKLEEKVKSKGLVWIKYEKE